MLQIEGYASLFGIEDLGCDIVMPGAFRESTRRNFRMLLMHDPGQLIGVWDKIYEDTYGLYVCGRILSSIHADEIIRGTYSGLSIGYKTLVAYRNFHTWKRSIYDIDLHEISVVTDPMLPDARITHCEVS